MKSDPKDRFAMWHPKHGIVQDSLSDSPDYSWLRFYHSKAKDVLGFYQFRDQMIGAGWVARRVSLALADVEMMDHAVRKLSEPLEG